MKKILILNGSPHSSAGNSAKLISKIQKIKIEGAQYKVLHLAELRHFKGALSEFRKADAYIFVTGTYWDSWGSPLQRFLEELTDLEGSQDILGKPCAIFVLKHSVGGKGVLSRLQGVLSSMGLLIPPMTGLVYSLVSDIALKGKKSVHKDDFWGLEDVQIVLENLSLSLQIQVSWITWPVDRKNFRKNWLK